MRKRKTKIDYVGLTNFLKSLDYDLDIETERNKPISPKLLKGTGMDDIEFFEIEDTPINRVIQYGMPFIVDCLGNDLSIVFLTKRKFKLPDGRLIRGKFDRTIIEDCRKLWGTPLNGYWVIPSQFITKK